jgi:Mg2+/Co2+ transporter CorB
MTLITICILIALLAISAFFSASETAITVASRAKFHHLAKEGNKRAEIIYNLQLQLGLVISVILSFNTMINSISVSLATGLLISLFGQEGVAYASVVMGIMILIYAEVAPKMAALINPEKFLLSTAPLLNFFFRLFRPINKLINLFSRAMLRLIGLRVVDNENLYTSIEEIRGVIDLHKGPGQDVEHERAMLKSILDLGSVQLGEIMVHRKNVTMIDAAQPMSQIVDDVLSCPFTRLPIWENSPENIVGVINAKALLRVVRNHQGDLNSLNIKEIAAAPWFVPESTDLLEQLQAFRKRREHFAIVVDEYGALMGIVTLEDILEEIVGEISDEHDIAVRGVRPQADGSWVVDGSVTLRDLNRQFDWDLPDEEASTIAGLLLYHFRMIPQVGQTFVLDGFRFEVLRRQRNQITLIRIQKEEKPKIFED